MSKELSLRECGARWRITRKHRLDGEQSKSLCICGALLSYVRVVPTLYTLSPHSPSPLGSPSAKAEWVMRR